MILVTPMNGAGLGAPNSVSFSQSLVSKFLRSSRGLGQGAQQKLLF